jgi:hypothetical protein
VVAFKGLVDKVIDVGLYIELFLGYALIKDVVEVKVFASVVVE